MPINSLVNISRHYGANPDFVLAGGGNTSLKENGLMYVKASGTTLGEITAEGFVRMDLEQLAAIWDRAYPDDPDKREEAVLTDLMNARAADEHGRPSVETLLHAMLPQTLVVHLHPALVNGLTCSQRGEKTAADLFGDDALWIPGTNPGYILAKTVNDTLKAHMDGGKPRPSYIFLQNHGVFVGGETAADIHRLYDRLMDILGGHIVRHPDLEDRSPAASDVRDWQFPLREILTEHGLTHVAHFAPGELLSFAALPEKFSPLSQSLTPDHIIYCGFKPLYLPDRDSPVAPAVNDFIRQHGSVPKITVINGIGGFAAGRSEKAAAIARAVFLDDLKIAVYAESFGAVHHMPAAQVDFIRNWEAEKYRSEVSAG